MDSAEAGSTHRKISSVKHELLIWLAAVFIVLATQVAVQSPDQALSDFPALYTASYLASHGQGSNMYSPDNQRVVEKQLVPQLNPPERTIWYFHPPVAVLMLLPLGFVSPDLARYIWYGLLVIAAVTASAVLCRTQSLPARALWPVAAGLACFGPLFDCIATGQPAPWLLMGIALFLWWQEYKNRPALAGISLVLLLLKPQLALPLIAFLIGARRYSTVCWFGIGMAILVVVSLVVPGVGSYHSYFELMKGALFGSPTLMQPELNPTLRGQLLRIFDLGSLQSEWIFDISAAVMVVAYVGFFALGRYLSDRPHWLKRGLLLLLPAGLVTAFHIQNYDLLLLAPVFLLLGSRWKIVPGIVQAATIITGILLLQPVYAPVSQFMHGGGIGVINVFFILLLMLSGCLAVYACDDRAWSASEGLAGPLASQVPSENP
jgi:hypothetical protein